MQLTQWLWKFIMLNTYIKKEEMLQVNYLNVHLKKLEKEMKP